MTPCSGASGRRERSQPVDVAHSTALLFAPDGHELPGALRAWLDARALTATPVRSLDGLMSVALRGRPALVLFDARSGGAAYLEGCWLLKLDSYTGVWPA